MKEFLYAGVAVKKDVMKVRWANDEKRINDLVKDGQTDIRLVPLPQAMSKLDSAKYISTLDVFADAEAQYTILEFIKTEESKSIKKPKEVKATKVVEQETELVDELEDLPY